MNGVLFVQPSEVLVYVKVTVPAETPVTTPALVTVATPLLLLVHDPNEFGVTFTVRPVQPDVAPPIAGGKMEALMVTLAEAGETQLFWFVTVNVNTIEAGRPVTVKLVPVPV